MRWGRAIAGGFIAGLILIAAVMPGFAMGSETVVTWQPAVYWVAHGLKLLGGAAGGMFMARRAAGAIGFAERSRPGRRPFRARPRHSRSDAFLCGGTGAW